ncbi:MAG: hypothetical protein Q7V88_00750 [Actinomycetota bacterium]|nr:hypothetical protein [Actinomycetota bacterium]
MAIDESDLPKGIVDTHADEAGANDAGQRYSLDDFRLRLDAPLFHRDPGMAAAAKLPQLRELTWEHVVKPNRTTPPEHSDAGGEPAAAGPGVLDDLDAEHGLEDGSSNHLDGAHDLDNDHDLAGDHDLDNDHDAGERVMPALIGVPPPAMSIEALLRHDPMESPPGASPLDMAGFGLAATPTAAPGAAPMTVSAALAAEHLEADVSVAPPPAETAPHPRKAAPQLESLSAALASGELQVHPPAEPTPAVPSPAVPSPAEQHASEAAPDLDDAMLSLVLPAEPRAREHDPVVHDLADQILRATPAAGQPRVHELFSALDEMESGRAPTAGAAGVPAAPEAPLAADLRAGPTTTAFDPATFDLVADLPAHEPSGPVARYVTGEVELLPRSNDRRPRTQDVPVVGSAVEAELNRLAFLPDQEEEVGPVQVPAIAQTDAPPPPAVPSLSQHEMYGARHMPVAHQRTNFFETAMAATTPARRKKKRNVLRRLVTFVLLLALIGGGLFAAKYYLLDQRWQGDAKELAAEVETQRGLTFDHAVDVTTLDVEDYSVRLARNALGITDADADATAAEWRALGLLNGPLDLRAIGLTAMADAPAFYEPGSDTVFVLKDLQPELRRFAVQRALTLALLDQHFGWGGRVGSASPAVVRGTMALYDGDALAVASALATPAERELVILQILQFNTLYQLPVTPSPFATAVTGRLGLSTRPYFESTANTARDALGTGALVTDGQVLDLRRLAPGVNETVPAQARGMLFWYHVLAARIDSDTAWRAALGWKSDDMSTTNVGAVCVSAVIQIDPATFDGAASAFTKWAAAAPAGSSTEVTSDATLSQVVVRACDPGANVVTNDGRSRLSLGGAILRAEQFHQLVTAQPALPAAQAACAVYGGDDVSTADDRPIIDGPGGWSAPAEHPLPDPNRLGCAPA